jgi:hypothetical protein
VPPVDGGGGAIVSSPGDGTGRGFGYRGFGGRGFDDLSLGGRGSGGLWSGSRGFAGR